MAISRRAAMLTTAGTFFAAGISMISGRSPQQDSPSVPPKPKPPGETETVPARLCARCGQARSHVSMYQKGGANYIEFRCDECNWMRKQIEYRP